MKKFSFLNHKTLAVFCGLMLLIIIGINVVTMDDTNKELFTTNSINTTTITNTETSNIDNSGSGDSDGKTIDNPTPIPSTRSVLDLSGKGLVEVPRSVFERDKVEVLDVSDNNLKGSLQAEIRYMQSLKVLDLSDNMFTGIPAEVGQLKNLEILDISNNSITGLPYEIGNLQKLQTLDLRGNKYSTLDLEIIRKSLPSTTEILVD